MSQKQTTSATAASSAALHLNTNTIAKATMNVTDTPDTPSCDSDDGFDLPHCGSLRSSAELTPFGASFTKEQGGGGSRSSISDVLQQQHQDHDGTNSTSLHHHHNLPLSRSSRGLASTAFTDDVEEYDAVATEGEGEEGGGSNGSEGSCRAEDLGAAGRSPSVSQGVADAHVSESIASDLPHPPAAVVEPLMSRYPFSSLHSSTTSWSAMRKLRLESAQHQAPPSQPTREIQPTAALHKDAMVDPLTVDQLRRPKQSSDDASHDGVALQTASAGLLTPSSCRAAAPESISTLRAAASPPLFPSNRSSPTLSAMTAAPSCGHWTLAPRLRGVNELLLSTAHAALFRAALDALHVWNTAVQLDLHHNSAGGTYMVRLAPAPHGTSTTPSREVLGIFKPRDEEIGQDTNPHGNRESDRAEAFAPGSGSRREVLAYRLDHGHNAGVPPTVEVATGYVAPPARRYTGPTTTTATATKACTAAIDGHSGEVPARQLGSVVRASPASPAGLSNLSMCTMATVMGGADRVTVRMEHHDPSYSLGGGGPATAGAVDDDDAGAVVGGASTCPQIGSLQLFLPGCQEAADVLPGRFAVEEVHALAIFDIRTLNGDRHGGNVLVQHYRRQRCSSRGRSQSGKDEATAPHLIPIDHSYICPSGYADPDYEWLSWPQAKKPFSPSNLHYIASLDAEADAELVRSALLAHSTMSCAAPMTSVDHAEGLNSSTRTVRREAEGRDRCWMSASCGSRAEGSAGEQGKALLLLDDGVRHACAIVQECGVPLRPTLHHSLSAWPATASTSAGNDCADAGASVATATTEGANLTVSMTPVDMRCCGSFDDLTIFSPVRCNAAHHDAADFGSPPQGFSMTALPDQGGSPTAARRAQDWARATAALLDLSDDDDDDDGHTPTDDLPKEEDAFSDEVQLGRSGKMPQGSPQSSSSTPSISFPIYSCSEPDGQQQQQRVNDDGAAVTYDKSAANAAAEVMRCTTRLLQIAALEFHMTAYEIGSLCRRPRVAQASFLEAVMEDARDEYSWEVVLSTFDSLVRRRLSAPPSTP